MIAGRAKSMHTNFDTRFKFENLAGRAIMMGNAVILIGLGTTLLTRPLAIPVTIAFWLGAVALAFLGIFGDFSD
jgi:hypothetical protein